MTKADLGSDLRFVRSRRRSLRRRRHGRSVALLFLGGTLSTSAVRIDHGRLPTLLSFRRVHDLLDVLRGHFQQIVGECLNANLLRKLIFDELT